MSFINAYQIWGAVLFFIGSWVLSICAKFETKEADEFRDIRNRYRDNIKKNPFTRSLRATLMTATGVLISLTGVVMFFMNIKFD